MSETNALEVSEPTQTSSTTEPTEATAEITHESAPESTDSNAGHGGIAGLKEAALALEKGGKTATKGVKTPEIPTYSPNFKFKVFDEEQKKDVEREFEDWAKGLIKTKDLEDKFRDVYTKVTGFETVKKSRNQMKNEVQRLQGEAEGFKKSLGILDGYVQGNDLQSFFESLKIPEDKILRYALDRINYHQLPDEKKREYDGARDLKYKSQILAEDNQRLETQFMQSQASMREQELGMALQSPDVKAIADAFDSRLGTPGAFRQEVVRRGQYYWHANKQDIPVSQAIREIVSLLGQPAQAQNTMTANAATTGGAEAVQAPEQKPIIPNIQGRGTSPAKKMPRSIADLKKLREGSI